MNPAMEDVDTNTCAFTCVSRCEKGFYESLSMKLEVSSVMWDNSYSYSTSFENVSWAREINLENNLKQYQEKFEINRKFKELSSGELKPSDYLRLIESRIPEELISAQNYSEIKNIAKYFTSGLTSFFGFEKRLMNPNAPSDYLIAVSALKGEREALVHLLEKENLPNNFLNRTEWQQLHNFAINWVNPKSEIHDKVLGIWLEFDINDVSSDISIPSVFLQTVPLRIDSPKDIEKCTWVTRNAIPCLEGRPISEKEEQYFLKIIKKLPKGASVFHVASMLSRKSEGMRVVIKRIHPDDMVPYLRSIGWADTDDGLSKLLQELKDFVDCIRLHINISDHVDLKIGLECFISPEKYNQENGWTDFLAYLVEKGLCQPELKSSLLEFTGVEQEHPAYNFGIDSYMPSVKVPDKDFSKALVRYISHVKISYEPKKTIEAKAYTGVRLFGRLESSS
ncbi:MAG: hypothetical protein JXA75_07125 [Candidatus Thermoplasmatota archaeon]|nr:hypothetical protein [Candidatus Thermoplasmatota archaeon]